MHAVMHDNVVHNYSEDGSPPIIKCSFASFLRDTRLNNINGRQNGV